ncbi:MAG: hypothetical protein US15_C0021G0011, partial [Candidatus Moranbacteria bacterium GW2011_GWF1_36_4]
LIFASDLARCQETVRILQKHLPNAKVIFGAVTDDQIRKGDIHITVVATGFDAEKTGKFTAEEISRMSVKKEDVRPMERIEKVRVESEEDAGDLKEQITFPTRKIESKMIIEEKVQPQRMSLRGETKREEDEDDELEIPAFIRRKMGK